ncbi:aromatic ring-opening dioxygenase (predicted) [Sugiyamaella lignohabitans]|uniref:Aromatic ring-opening dioxygenase (Predicted) n=1 Tax=Sugiyamaella lignohabitans TaxID=796027 RepID=A0A167DNL7_9ASCO|nr:aromatic ring-opening dioxygenase (predicted) [Sugiyamaella lignohabitans]ANB13110.1 aromatic ring-opening dioxygenase (predicted) [Sugiyamaella lignohabitans]
MSSGEYSRRSQHCIISIIVLALATIAGYFFIKSSDNIIQSKQHSDLVSAGLPGSGSSTLKSPSSHLLEKVETRNIMPEIAPALFVSHGGGPLPLLNVPDHKDLVDFLGKHGSSLLNLNGPNKPKALVVVTAHWETAIPAVSTRTTSELLFDYYGFPKETYQYTYKAEGSVQVAELVAGAIKKGGFSNVTLDSKRGWDHGVFVPLKVIAPGGLDIPLIMISVLKSQNPTELLKLGRALAPLREQGIAFLGSGTTFHNFDGLLAPPPTKQKFYAVAEKFEQHMNQVLTADREGSDEEQRDSRLSLLEKWQSWPGASAVQPVGAQDHFSPLVVLAGTLLSKKATRAKYLDLSGLPASIWSF